MKIFAAGLMTLLLFGCASARTPMQKSDVQLTRISVTADEQSERKAPRLILDAFPRSGFAPMRVTFTARLENVSASDEMYLCMQEQWQYGDGAVSAQQLDCTSTTPSLINEYLSEHVYDAGGIYSIILVLGDELIRSNKVNVRVISRR